MSRAQQPSKIHFRRFLAAALLRYDDRGTSPSPDVRFSDAWVYVNNPGERKHCVVVRRATTVATTVNVNILHIRRINIRPRGLIKDEINYLMESFLCVPCHVPEYTTCSFFSFSLALFLSHTLPVFPPLILQLFLLCRRIRKSCTPKLRNLSSGVSPRTLYRESTASKVQFSESRLFTR